jgi:hypothetical protein
MTNKGKTWRLIMKKGILGILVVMLLTLLSLSGATAFADTLQQPVNYELSKVTISGSVEESTDRIDWLAFTFTGYPEERAIVRNHFARDIAEIEAGKWSSSSNVPIAIALGDVNGDSKPDIIYILFHPYFSGAWHNGVIGAFVVNDDGLQFVPLVNVSVRMKNIEEQKEIGLINNPKSRWKSFVLNGKLWERVGEHYK